MNIFTLSMVSCVGLSLLVSCSNNLTSGNGTTKPSSRVSGSERAVGERIFNLVNAERVSAGKQRVSGSADLNELAQKQANHLSQKGSNGIANTAGAGMRAQIAHLRHNISNVTELANATNSASPGSDTVHAWSNSPAHRKIMLQSWNRIGVGVSKSSDGHTYITMLLGSSITGAPRSLNPVGF